MSAPQLNLNEAPAQELVSVVIPCFNQAHFLGQAIESVLAQSYPHVERIVVDDGSTDNTWEVAGRYPGVHRIQQPNRGLPAARNTGLRAARGAFVVFLDADDLLRPEALAIGVEHLSRQPECAFVSGRYQRIAANRLPLPTPDQEHIRSDHYLAMLRGNYIGMHAAVMYRRRALEAVGGFDPSLPAAEDYDLYLRIARNFPVCCHERVVAEYRQHEGNMSRDHWHMLAAVLRVLRAQREHVRGHADRERAYGDGIRNWRQYYATELLREARAAWRKRAVKRGVGAAITGLRAYPSAQWARRAGRRLLRRCRRWLRAPRAASPAPPVGQVSFGDMQRLTPLSQAWGFEHPRSIQRYYADQFFRCHAGDMRGRVLEVGGGAYTCRLAAADRAADLSGVEGLAPGTYDCIVVPRGFESVYCLETAVSHLRRALRPGGVLLATLAGLLPAAGGQEEDYWRFTQVSARRLFQTAFPPDHLLIRSYGNVLTAIILSEGLGADHLDAQELDHVDPDYQITIGVRAMNAFQNEVLDSRNRNDTAGERGGGAGFL